MDKYFSFMGFLLAVAALIPVVQAYPTIHNVYGNVFDADGKPLPGVEVKAWVDGTMRGSSVTKDYAQGYESYYLIDVSGDTEEDGAIISFTLDGAEYAQSLVYAPLGKTELNLTLGPGGSSDSLPQPATSTTMTAEQETSTSSLFMAETVEADSTSSTSLVSGAVEVVAVSASPEAVSGAVTSVMPDENITPESTTSARPARVVEAGEDDACYECPQEIGGGIGTGAYPLIVLAFVAVVLLILLKKRR